MKGSSIGSVPEELPFNQKSTIRDGYSDKHLILRYKTPRFATATISASTIAEKKFNPCRDPVKKAGDLPYR